MKHTSWLSGLVAVRNPRRAASARTSALVRLPDREPHPVQPVDGSIT